MLSRKTKMVMVIELYSGEVVMCTDVEKTRNTWYFKTLTGESMVISQFKVKSVKSLTEFYYNTQQRSLLN